MLGWAERLRCTSPCGNHRYAPAGVLWTSHPCIILKQHLGLRGQLYKIQITNANGPVIACYASCTSNADNGCRKGRWRWKEMLHKTRVIDFNKANFGIECSACLPRNKSECWFKLKYTLTSRLKSAKLENALLSLCSLNNFITFSTTVARLN